MNVNIYYLLKFDKSSILNETKYNKLEIFCPYYKINFV